MTWVSMLTEYMEVTELSYSNINMTIHGVKIIDLPAYQIAIVSYLKKKYGITEVSKYIREVVKNESK